MIMLLLTGAKFSAFFLVGVYNRMWKNGANSAIDIKIFGPSNSNVVDILIVEVI
jgi:hypothetical protein